MTRSSRFPNSSALSVLACAVALALSACGGGGGGAYVRPTPPPPPVNPGGGGFTPTVATDSSLTRVNPPEVPRQEPPVTFVNPSLSEHLSLINAAGALGAGLKGVGVTIGLIDSGVNRNHPSLTGRVGANFVNVDPDTNDLSVDDKIGHGTVVASLAAGVPTIGNYLNEDGSNSGNTGQWGGGVAQQARIVSSRIIGDAPPVDDGSGEGNEIGAGQGYGDYFAALNGQLADAGAKIINNSWGGLYWNDPTLTTELAEGWSDFVVDRGGIIVFANGNSGEDAALRGEPSDNARLPTLANDPELEKGWFTVGALDPDNPTQLTDYSQECGSAMNYCLVAPGNVVFINADATSQATSGLYVGGGTSFAAPLVAGAAAVVWSAFRYFDNDLVHQTVLGAAKDLGAPGVDPVFGWGLLDVTKAANGPSNFAWGDVGVSFNNITSVWRNSIIGAGGLTKSGSGTLILTQRTHYTGNTRVMQGGLYLKGGSAASDLIVSQGATVWAGGLLQGVDNNGTLLAAASGSVGASDFSQGATGNLGVWLGNTFNVSGTATLDGQVSILGVKSGYTTSAQEKLLTAGSITGTFAKLAAAPNVFLDASLSYDPTTVFLDIKRIDVTKAVAGMGLSGITAASAQRVESAMDAIDGQLSGISPAGIGSGFIDAAGALQHSTSVANADVSLRTLSGQLHSASSALTFDTIDTGRRALDGRIDRLGGTNAAGGWYRDLASSGTLAQAGHDSVAMDAQGRMIGNDWRIDDGNAVVGVAMSQVRQAGWLGAFGDRSRGQQREAQLYAAAWRGDWYGQAQLALGGFDREMQRNLLLGARRDAVATNLSGNYQSAFAEVGRRFDVAGVALTPYAGSQYAHIANDGFAESGDTGFGLRAQQWDSSRWQGFAGLRAEHGWTFGNVELRADARTEWQQTLSSQGELFEASFTGLDQWAPLQGMGLADHGVTFATGLSAAFSDKAVLRLDATRRDTALGANNTISLQGTYRF